MKPIQKPVNNKVTSCDDVTSTCVTWDGPALSFACMNIEVCKGETINVVLYELFKNLCIALEKTDITGISTTCLFDLPSEPDTIEDLLNLIIRKLCDQDVRILSLEDVEYKTYSANLPYCLQNINDTLTITKLPIDQYFNKVAVKMCEQIADLNEISNSDPATTDQLEEIQTQLALLDSEITAACAPIAGLEVTPTCSAPAVPTPLNTALEYLESAFCSYINFTGSVEELNKAIALDCPNLGSLQALSNTNQMDQIYGWVDTPINVADSVNNLWLTICDMRSAIRNILMSCCVNSPCLSFVVFYELQFDPNNQWMDIVFNDGVYPSPTPMPGLYGTQTIIKSLDRLSQYDGSIPPPAWIATDFPTIGNVIITINDGSGDIVLDTGSTLVDLMHFAGPTGGKYRFNYTPDYDYNAPVKSIKIEFNYTWNNLSPPVPGGTTCEECECCCTYSIINGIY